MLRSDGVSKEHRTTSHFTDPRHRTKRSKKANAKSSSSGINPARLQTVPHGNPPVARTEGPLARQNKAATESPNPGQSTVETKTIGQSDERADDEKLASIARAYCSNNLASAAEVRMESKQKTLRELEARIDRKVEELGKLKADALEWVERREKGRAAARDSLVDAYSKMRPEAAAQQIGAMNDEAAVGLLLKMNARAAGAIMNEMGADRAARLADKALGFSRRSGDLEKNGS